MPWVTTYWGVVTFSALRLDEGSGVHAPLPPCHVLGAQTCCLSTEKKHSLATRDCQRAKPHRTGLWANNVFGSIRRTAVGSVTKADTRHCGGPMVRFYQSHGIAVGPSPTRDCRWPTMRLGQECVWSSHTESRSWQRRPSNFSENRGQSGQPETLAAFFVARCGLHVGNGLR